MSTTDIASTRIANGRSTRRGSAYVLFLATATLITLIGLFGLTLSRVQRRVAETSNDALAARNCARSAIELGLVMIDRDDKWRGTRGPGAWFTDMPIGDGAMSLDVQVLDDGDGNPLDDTTIFKGTGAVGGARAIYEVRIVSSSAKGGMVLSPTWSRVTE